MKHTPPLSFFKLDYFKQLLRHVSTMHESTYRLTFHHLFQVAHHIHVEHIDRQVVVVAHHDSREIHHLQSPGKYLFVCYIVELHCRGVFLRVGSIDAIYPRAFQHHIGFYLHASQRGACVCGEIRRTGTCREDASIASIAFHLE